LAGRERIYDNESFDSWLARKLDGKEKAANSSNDVSAEYRVAFQAWLKTNPFHNAEVSPGPMFMPEYHNAKHETFLEQSKQASDSLRKGTEAGETGDQYVRITVILATVLLITALGQRFRVKAVPTAFMILACLLLSLPPARLFMLPRI